MHFLNLQKNCSVVRASIYLYCRVASQKQFIAAMSDKGTGCLVCAGYNLDPNQTR